MQRLEDSNESQMFSTNTQDSSPIDNRILIPFEQNNLIGFKNRFGDVVIRPIYDLYLGEAQREDDLIIVMNKRPYQYKGSKRTYNHLWYGMINGAGKVLLDTAYRDIHIQQADMDKIITLKDQDKGYTVLNAKLDTIVPFDRYCIIDPFDKGFARVAKWKTDSDGNPNRCWGIINYTGEEVLPCIYREVYFFFGKNRTNTLVIKKIPNSNNLECFNFYFETGQLLKSNCAPKDKGNDWCSLK